MTQVQLVLAIIGALVVLASAAGGVWAVFRSSSQDARIKRLSDENSDLVRRVEFLEPRVRDLTAERDLLRQQLNPAEQIKDLAGQEQRNHEATVAVLERIETALRSE